MPKPTLPLPTPKEIRELVEAHADWIGKLRLELKLDDEAQAERFLCAAREAGYPTVEAWALDRLDREGAAILSEASRRLERRRQN
jgi:hypothetical protein